MRNAVEALHADSDLFPHGDWNDAVAERVTVNDSGGRFDLAFRKIVDGMQQLCVAEEQHCRKRIAQYLQVRVDDVRLIFGKNAVQSAVHPVVESRLFCEIANFDSRLRQQFIEVAVHGIRKRNDNRLKTLAVQPVDDVNGDALGAAGTQHRNDMDYSDSTHDIGLKVGASPRECRGHTSCRANNSILETTRGGWRH